MKIELYTALVDVRIPPEKAKQLVEAVEGHVDMQISHNVIALGQRMDAMTARFEARFEALEARFDAMNTKFEAVLMVLADLKSDRDIRTVRFRWVIATMLTTATVVTSLLVSLHALGKI